MKKWSKQSFLNPADSNDDGWFKFSIRPKPFKKNPRGSYAGVDIQFIVSDCSNKIYLEFAPRNVSINEAGFITETPENVQRVLQSIKNRRKKIDLFANAVRDFQTNAHANLDAFEADIMDRLNKED